MKKALISVYDHTNIEEFAKGLIKYGYEIISTGNTYDKLKKAKINVKSLKTITQFPEILGGLVNTLHPKVHGGILASQEERHHKKQLESNNIEYIDLVCVNLNPIVNLNSIDIGGSTMIRSASKNYNYVTTIVDINDYRFVLDEIQSLGNVSFETRKKLAGKAYRYVASIDAMIADLMSDEDFPERLTITYQLSRVLRYGENPHQKGAFYKSYKNLPYSLVNSSKIQGKELSYNNIQDANAALEIIHEFNEPAVVALKHMNPFGVVIGKDINDVWFKFSEIDPISLYGGIIATNQEINKDIAINLSNSFLELVMAPNFSEEAKQILSNCRNLILIEINMSENNSKDLHYVSVKGGLLVQEDNQDLFNESQFTIPTICKPTNEEMEQLKFAWKVVKHVKSNASVIAKNNITIGIGAGQMSRIGACKLAIEHASYKCVNAVLASDAFIPMNDSIEVAAKAGIKAIIQPGGSTFDQESIDLCNQHQIAMVLTGIRHFKH